MLIERYPRLFRGSRPQPDCLLPDGWNTVVNRLFSDLDTCSTTPMRRSSTFGRSRRSSAAVASTGGMDRLGRDALDVQATVRTPLKQGVAVDVHGLGRIGRGPGDNILAVLAQVAEMERLRIKERTGAGRDKARQSLAATGVTHRGKESLGRPNAYNPLTIAQWRVDRGASIAATAKHFGCSIATVKRSCFPASLLRPTAYCVEVP